MNTKKTLAALAIGGVAVIAVISTASATGGTAKSDTSAKTSEATVVTNDNGSVSRTFTEMNVTTNGNMVTEHRRETRTTTDAMGNILATATSEYAQSYTAGDGWNPPASFSTASSSDPSATRAAASSAAAAPAPAADSFLGLKFGEVFEGTNFVNDADEPTMLRATFTPAKTLAGFDDYYVYVTPKTHRVVKVYACAKDAVEPGARYRRHYLIEALEKRYQTWARLVSFSRPKYAFDLGDGRYAIACLAGASRDYETVLCAGDDAMLRSAVDETEELRDEARKAAAEKRSRRVSDAASAF